MEAKMRALPVEEAPAFKPKIVAAEPEKSPFRFVVRCLIERKGNQWQAFSLELGLAAQDDSFQGVKRKLEAMIDSYLHDDCR